MVRPSWLNVGSTAPLASPLRASVPCWPLPSSTQRRSPMFMASVSSTMRSFGDQWPAEKAGNWSPNDRIVLLTDAMNMGDLRWVELGSGQQGTLARNGDANGAVEPTFSHDGRTIVYVSTPRSSIHDGRLDTAPSDLWVVPYADR